MNRILHRCPTCKRELDKETRDGMGLRNGEALNALLPGRIGPSDIDHVLHNGSSAPGRVLFLEYKAGGAVPGRGQQILHDAIRGRWRDGERELLVDVRVLDEKDESQLPEVIEWLGL